MVEIIPKEVPKLPRWLNILFYFSLILLFSSIISYFVLYNSLKKSKEELANLTSTITETMTPEKAALEKEILDKKNSIDNFSPLVEQHLKSSKIFEIIEKYSHPEVWFSNIDLKPRDGSLKLSGEAKSFESIGQQLLIFRESKLFVGVDLNGLSITEKGKVGFDLTLRFYTNILQ